MHWCFVVNPMAGGGKAKRNLPRLTALLNENVIDYIITETTKPKHGVELVKDLALSGERLFVAVGGDGSLNEVLQGIVESTLPIEEFTLTVLPWGSGNDWARFHKIPHQTEKWISFFKQQQRVKHDIGIASFGADFESNHAFINLAGTGLDCMVLQEMGQAAGLSFRYYLTMLRCLRRYKAVNFNVSYDGRRFETPALMLIHCLGRYGGAGMDFAPDANTNNGKFNGLCIKDMTFVQRLLGLRYPLNGSINQHDRAESYVSREIEINSDREWYFECDGELIAPLPARLTMHPQALCVLSNLS
ncbi:diacylglycerol/lipid kinase family protein [Vibrio tapetis]|uniref:DAGKc domain-containing protein n=1 Tax=Vibrio tapetis subsp. tapetis TaxID=1671868 RepID=A0A2N8ZA62_9VIBR|nr:diacylglycerol kinase family protein [Vibrio tapetis]SON48805.1 conserved protein of unknown function [Vibrio tapetis subsp. tapetis]